MLKLPKLLMLAGLLAAALAACLPQPQRFTLTAHDMLWSLHEIDIRAGQPVELTLRNEGALDHVFQIDDLDVQVLLSPGDVEIITFTIKQPGVITFICSIPGHEEAGMLGQIVVSE
ncbi:MAG TPA: cupredoxin domain-containing protein [Anaerolineales bacterium]|nr:cupredoxin domain-containing protein [Anaerolineales bacterium]HRQ92087.1 cupredoxin domain-containing protein [Anaerolineales bacterium]